MVRSHPRSGFRRVVPPVPLSGPVLQHMPLVGELLPHLPPKRLQGAMLPPLGRDVAPVGAGMPVEVLTNRPALCPLHTALWLAATAAKRLFFTTTRRLAVSNRPAVGRHQRPGPAVGKARDGRRTPPRTR